MDGSSCKDAKDTCLKSEGSSSSRGVEGLNPDLTASSVKENELSRSSHGINEASNDLPVSLVEENERLRSQLLEMEIELSRLKQSSPSPSRKALARRKNSGTGWKWLNHFQRAPQDDLSDEGNDPLFAESPTEGQELAELPSPTGLHQRHVPGSPKFKPLVQRDTLAIPTLKAKYSDLELAESPENIRSPMESFTDEPDDGSQVSQLSLERSEDDETFRKQLQDRASWLVGLLVLQSCSSFIIKNNQEMLAQHIVIVRFLTMLVGAGGNAGNQASVRVIRGLAVGTVNDGTVRPYLREEAKMGFCLSAILGVAGCARAAIFMTPLAETLAITASLVCIVAISILIGALLPLGMNSINIDPAHSSTTIQVLMDIVGVTITVYISGALLDSAFGAMLNAVSES